MKKIFLILALSPFYVHADNGFVPDVSPNSPCAGISDAKEQADCLGMEKQTDAEQHFEQFEDNNQSAYQPEF